MKFHFDLTEEPWVPAIALKDGRVHKYNLRDVIAQAHNLSELFDPSPLVTVSLHRLLLAVIHRCYPVSSQRGWLHLWEQECFSRDCVDAYLKDKQDRFDLFSETHPFYQVAGLELDNPDGLNRLAAELASGNNATLFDHTVDSKPVLYSPAQAARLVVASQSFSFAGLLRRSARLEGEEFYWQNSYNAILLPGATIWLTGDTLFETLMLNFIPRKEQTEGDEDLPAWERDQPFVDRAKMIAGKLISPPARGPVDRFTWQSRLLRLLPEQQNGRPMIRYVYFTQGRSPDTSPNAFDPMQAYYQDQKRGWLVFRLSREKAIWRDAHALLGLATPTKKTPDAYELISRLIAYNRVHRDRCYRLHVVGLASDQAKVYLWRHDRMNLPGVLLVDPDLIASLEVRLREAEDTEWKNGNLRCRGVAKQLYQTMRAVCELYLSPDCRDIRGKPSSEGRQPDPENVLNLLKTMDPRRAYWARLEPHFQTLLLSLAGNPADIETARERWRDAVEHEAKCAFEEALAGLGNRTRAIQAAARVYTKFTVASRQGGI